jgi:mono/diheme cytochrome c family protein
MTQSILPNLLLGTCALGLVAAIACQKQADTATAQPAEATAAPTSTSPAEPAAKPDAEAEAADAEAAAAAEKRARDRVEVQVTAGEAVYDKTCGRCHGKEGQGRKGKYPPVMGDTALPEEPPKRARLRKDEFSTAQGLLDFVQESMPPRKGGSLSEEEYLAVVAFLASANGIQLSDAITVDNASEVDLFRDTGE